VKYNLKKPKQQLAKKDDTKMFSMDNTKPIYERSTRYDGTVYGGCGAIKNLISSLQIKETFDKKVDIFKEHHGYTEGDHILNFGLASLCGAERLEDINTFRNDKAFVKAMGAKKLPASSTAGDFCRRFKEEDIETLMNSINDIRVSVWKMQTQEFLSVARIDADGTFVETGSECTEGADFTYKKTYGYHPLVVSLANTQEPLFIVNRSGNRPSHEGAHHYLNKAINVCKEAGFKKIILRGDTDFSQTAFLDNWDEQGIQFVFGHDASRSYLARAYDLDENNWNRLAREKHYVEMEYQRSKKEKHKKKKIEEREYKNLELEYEEYSEFMVKPSKAKKEYRVVVIRKMIKVHKGQELLAPEIKYFFYITNMDIPAREVISIKKMLLRLLEWSSKHSLKNLF
jgi:hypothetical protein